MSDASGDGRVQLGDAARAIETLRARLERLRRRSKESTCCARYAIRERAWRSTALWSARP